MPEKNACRTLILFFEIQLGCVVYGHHQIFIVMSSIVSQFEKSLGGNIL